MRSLLVSLAVWMTPGLAQAGDIVDGAVCAHLAHQIEKLGAKNEAMLEDIAQAQIADLRGEGARKSLELIAGRDALVALRTEWIADYEAKCSGMSLSVNDLRRICKPVSNVAMLRDTVFCQPVRDAGL